MDTTSWHSLTAFSILGIIAFSVVLGFFQEFRASKESEALDRPLVSKAVSAGSLAALVAVILLFVLRESPADVALDTLGLAVATIPESLPILLTFALGAYHMAARHAVVRRLPVVESLGSWIQSAPIVGS